MISSKNSWFHNILSLLEAVCWDEADCSHVSTSTTWERKLLMQDNLAVEEFVRRRWVVHDDDDHIVLTELTDDNRVVSAVSVCLTLHTSSDLCWGLNTTDTTNQPNNFHYNISKYFSKLPHTTNLYHHCWCLLVNWYKRMLVIRNR